MVAVDTEDEKRIIWHGFKKLNKIDPKPVESVWWNPSWRTTICDFRKYINGKAFGISSATDASVVIYPEEPNRFGLGFMQFCPSLKMVYVHPVCRNHLRLRYSCEKRQENHDLLEFASTGGVLWVISTV